MSYHRSFLMLFTQIAQHCAKTSQAQAALQGQEARLKPLSKAELEAGNPAWAKKVLLRICNGLLIQYSKWL